MSDASRRIEALGLSTATRSALEAAGVTTIAELCARSSGAVAAMPGVSGIMLRDIERRLAAHGLRLAAARVEGGARPDAATLFSLRSPVPEEPASEACSPPPRAAPPRRRARTSAGARGVGKGAIARRGGGSSGASGLPPAVRRRFENGLKCKGILSLFETRATDEHVRIAVGLAGAVEEVELAHIPTITDDAIAHLAPLAASLRVLSLSWSKQIGDGALGHLQRFERLETLNLGGVHVSDAGLAHLRALPRLTWIDADCTPRITGAGLAGGFPSLSVLHAGDTVRGGIDDAGLRAIAMLPALRNLLVAGSFGDAGAEALGRATELEGLCLKGRGLTDAGLRAVGRLGNLRYLSIGFGVVGDAGMAHLAGLERLETLDVAFTNVGDAGMVHLTRLRALKSLMVSDRVSKGTVHKLQNTLSALERVKRVNTGT